VHHVEIRERSGGVEEIKSNRIKTKIMSETTNIYQKLHNARKYIKTCDVKKLGYNEFSKYSYFTPEQISQVVFLACEDQKLLPMFHLTKDEHGYKGSLTIINLENTKELIRFSMSTAIPEITATNAAQQLGGAVTYTERYMLMTAFDIKDNNLDFDSKEQKPEPQTKEPTEWLNKWSDKAKTKENPTYWTIVNKAKEQGKTVNDLREYYKISKEIASELETDLI
jgi:hypothetical protein